MVGLAARFGLLTLASPYDALSTDVALIGLGILAVIEIGADKIPGLGYRGSPGPGAGGAGCWRDPVRQPAVDRTATSRPDWPC